MLGSLGHRSFSFVDLDRILTKTCRRKIDKCLFQSKIPDDRLKSKIELVEKYCQCRKRSLARQRQGNDYLQMIYYHICKKAEVRRLKYIFQFPARIHNYCLKVTPSLKTKKILRPANV